MGSSRTSSERDASAALRDDAPESDASAKRKLFVIVGIVALSYVGVSLPYPILAPHILGSDLRLPFGGGLLTAEQTLAVVLAAYPAGMFVGNQVLGSCADRFGRKPTLLLSVAASGVGYLLSALALLSGSMWGLALSRLATGAFEGNVPIARAMATDLSDAVPVARSFGYIGGAVYAGYLIGPVIGGGFAGTSVALPFFVAAGLTLPILVLIFAVLVEPSRGREAAKSGRPSLNPWSLLADRRLLHLFVVNMLATLGVFAFYQFYPILLTMRQGFGPLEIAAVTVVLTIGLWGSSSFLVGMTADRYDVRRVLCMAGLVFAATFLALPSMPGIVAVSALFFVSGVVIPLFTTHLSAYTSGQLGSGLQGSLMGLLGSGGAAGSCVIVLIGASLASRSLGFPVLLGVGTVVAAVGYFLLLVPRERSVAA